MAVTNGTRESGSRWLGAHSPWGAVVGAGFMGRVHAEPARRAGGRVVPVAAGGRAGAMAIGAERGYPGVGTLLSDVEIDVLHVCAPNIAHADIVRAALAAPLVPDLARLVAAAPAAGKSGALAFLFKDPLGSDEHRFADQNRQLHR